MRSSGYVTAAGLRMWAQRRTHLREDIVDLTRAVHGAFCASITTRDGLTAEMMTKPFGG